MKEESNNHRIDPELEARIVALVLGEASEEERAQLDSFILKQPELALFKNEIESAHRLLTQVGSGEWTSKESDWKLSPEKRDAVLAVIGGHASQRVDASSKAGTLPFLVKDTTRWNLLRFAAAICGAGIFSLLAMMTLLVNPSSRVTQKTSAAFSFEQTADTQSVLDPVAAEAYDAPTNSAWMYREQQVDSANGRASDEFGNEIALLPAESDFNLQGLRTDSMPEGASREKSLAANDALPRPYFLDDDVQSFPSDPEVKLPRESVRLQEGNAVGNIASSLSDVESVELQLQQKQEDYVAATPEAVANAPVDSDVHRFRYFDPAAKPESPAPLPALGSSIPDQTSAQAASQDPLTLGERPGIEAKNLEVAGKVIDTKGADADSDHNGPVDSFWSDAGAERFGATKEEVAQEAIELGYKLKALAETQAANGVIVGRGVARNISPDNFNQDLMEPFAEDAPASVDAVPIEVPAQAEAVDMPKEAAPELFVDLGLDRNVKIVPSFGAPEVMPQTAPNEVHTLRQESDTTARGRVLSSDKKDSLGEDHTSQLGTAMVPMFGRSFGGVELDVAEVEAEILGRKVLNVTPAKKAPAAAGLEEVVTANERFSTFSLHVSDVSFKLAQAALARSEWPEAAKVRIEEFVNAFDYGDPMPSEDEKVACQIEQSIHPFIQQRNLLRVSMRTAAAGRAASTPLRITFLLDNSGSMERIDRQQTVRRAFAMLAQQLAPTDQVTLISFARQPRLLADKVNGAQSSQLVQLIDSLPSEGGTNIEAALQLAFEKASEQQLDGAQNRIVLLTDGAVNLGDANPERLSEMVTSIRDAGIAFDAAGISAEGLNDEVLEALTRKGDGRYYLLDTAEDADEGFARQIAGALRPSAKNVKVQVEFNPKRVRQYKLLGFEKHLLNQEDFRNDSVDAAELAAEEAGVAVYQFESMPDGEGDVGSVSVRFRDLSTGEMIENRWPIPYEADAQRCEEAAPSMCIATVAAMFAAKLHGEPLGESVDLNTLSELLAGLPEQVRNAKRVQSLQTMIGQALQLSGNQ